MTLLKRSSLVLIVSLFMEGRQAAIAADKKVNAPPVLSAKAQQQLKTSSLQKVSVELEWDIIEGAKKYEIEFLDLQAKPLKTFNSKTNIFKFQFRVGKYYVHARVADERGVFSDWSATTEFTVQPKPAFVNEKSIQTNGKINPKTLTSEVTYHWGQAPGASEFRVKVINDKDEVIKEAVVKGFYYRTELAAGTYTSTLTSINDNGIESEPVTLPGKVVIETVQLPAPEIVFEESPDPADPKAKIQRLPQADGLPVLRLKPNSLSDTVGQLEYRFFFGDEWLVVKNFTSLNAKEVILDKAKKPGRYRITVWAEGKGLKKSEPTTYEFVVKPTSY